MGHLERTKCNSREGLLILKGQEEEGKNENELGTLIFSPAAYEEET